MQKRERDWPAPPPRPLQVMEMLDDPQTGARLDPSRVASMEVTYKVPGVTVAAVTVDGDIVTKHIAPGE